MKIARSAQRGVSLLDFLIAMVLLGIAVTITVPLVAERVRTAKLRAAAGQFAADLRAARMIAVSNRKSVNVLVTVDPGNAYTYTDARGHVHDIEMPGGVRITGSTSPIEFRPNGSVTQGTSTTLETELSGGAKERYTLTTSVLGLPRLEHQRIEP